MEKIPVSNDLVNQSAPDTVSEAVPQAPEQTAPQQSAEVPVPVNAPPEVIARERLLYSQGIPYNTTFKQAALVMKRHPRTISRWIEKGTLPVIRRSCWQHPRINRMCLAFLLEGLPIPEGLRHES